MAVEIANASWIPLVGSSAVVSALVNVAWNWYAKRQDGKREEDREADREAKRLRYASLSLAIDLERFARECAYLVTSVDVAKEFIRGSNDSEFVRDQFARIRVPTLALTVDENWRDLNLKFVSHIRRLMSDYEADGDWVEKGDFIVGMQWGFLQDRALLHGRDASQLAEQLRADSEVFDLDAASPKVLEEVWERRLNDYRSVGVDKHRIVLFHPALWQAFIDRS